MFLNKKPLVSALVSTRLALESAEIASRRLGEFNAKNKHDDFIGYDDPRVAFFTDTLAAINSCIGSMDLARSKMLMAFNEDRDCGNELEKAIPGLADTKEQLEQVVESVKVKDCE